MKHYRAFIAQLENKGADLSHVKVGKSVMVRASTQQDRESARRCYLLEGKN